MSVVSYRRCFKISIDRFADVFYLGPRKIRNRTPARRAREVRNQGSD